MVAVKLSVTIDEQRRLVIDLPDDVPVGPAELVIRPLTPTPTGVTNPAREELRARLLAAGLLVLPEDLGIPDDIEPVSDEELEILGQMPLGARPSEELIDEDRGER